MLSCAVGGPGTPLTLFGYGPEGGTWATTEAIIYW